MNNNMTNPSRLNYLMIAIKTMLHINQFLEVILKHSQLLSATCAEIPNENKKKILNLFSPHVS